MKKILLLIFLPLLAAAQVYTPGSPASLSGSSSGGGGGPPTGAAGGGLSGTYPNPAIATAIVGITSVTSPASTALTLATLDTNQNILFTPNGTGKLGVNQAAPQQLLDLGGSITSPANLILEQVSADASSGGLFGLKGRGTVGTPDFPQASDVLLTLGGGGWNGTTLYNYNKATIQLRALNLWSASDNSTDMSFGTTPAGSTTRAEQFRMSYASIQAFAPIIDTALARTTLALPYFTINIPADTGITAATEGPGFKTVTAIRTWATTGTVALQRENFWAGPTYASASPSQTFTDAFTGYMTPPVAGTNAIFTRDHTFGIVDATSAASSITGGLIVATTVGTAATSVGIGGGNVNAGGLITGGTMTSTGLFTASAASTLTGAVSQTAKTAKYNNVSTVGWGIPAIYGAGRVTAQAAANASISTYTCGAADGSFEVSGNMNVTVSTALATTMTCTYTDESNTSRVMVLPIQQLTGSFVAGGAITGVGAWESPVMHIRVKASTAITIATSAGTFTGVTYTAEGIIKQTN